MRELELYIHIPFCVRKCLYCDFLSAPATDEVKEKYVEALIREIISRSDKTAKVKSVFFGGGTPSAISKEFIGCILEAIFDNFDVSKTAEITMEINPGTVTEKSLEYYKKIGINRLSIGLQSTNDAELKALGRIHDYETFLACYRYAVSAGFDNINVDLMSAIPGQTIESYTKSLERIVALNPKPKHISAYSLIVEEGTPFYDMYEEDKLSLPDEETDRLMYDRTEEFLLKNGYHRYEISNYSLEGFECIHNCGYWTGVEYLGFGIGAASYIIETSGYVRKKNISDINTYIKRPEEANDASEELHLSKEDRMSEFMFLGLRMTAGVSANDFYSRFEEDLYSVYKEAIDSSLEDGLLERYEQNGLVYYSLTKRGLSLSNVCMSRFC